MPIRFTFLFDEFTAPYTILSCYLIGKRTIKEIAVVKIGEQRQQLSGISLSLSSGYLTMLAKKIKQKVKWKGDTDCMLVLMECSDQLILPAKYPTFMHMKGHEKNVILELSSCDKYSFKILKFGFFYFQKRFYYFEGVLQVIQRERSFSSLTSHMATVARVGWNQGGRRLTWVFYKIGNGPNTWPSSAAFPRPLSGSRVGNKESGVGTSNYMGNGKC